jgi:hypothetical protein
MINKGVTKNFQGFLEGEGLTKSDDGSYKFRKIHILKYDNVED